MKTKHDFLSITDLSVKEILGVFTMALKLKKEFKGKGSNKEFFKGKTLAMIFEKPSLRTRISFEAAMDQLGGNSHDLVAANLQLSHGDTPKEVGKILSSYGHGLAIRHCDWQVGNKYINEIAMNSSVPVFNMQCDIYHPFQAMADLMTILEKKATLKDKKIVMSWAYASSYTKPISVPQSFLLLLSQFGADLTLAYPEEFKLMPEIMEQVEKNNKESGGKLVATHNMEEAFANADVVYPKSWGPLVTTDDPEEGKQIINKYKNWICDSSKMKLTKKGCIYLHCLPADRGLEVTDEVIDGPQSAVFDQAENRLHIQKAILALTMGGK